MLIERAKKRTPVFFKNVRKAGLYLSGFSLSIIAVPGIELYPEFVSLFQHLATIGATMAAIATFAVQNESEIQDPPINN